MALTSDQKNSLSSNESSINDSFTKFGNRNTYMGVYFSDTNRAYITFSASDNFSTQSPLKFGGRTYTYCCTYVTADDFTTQTANFLNN